MSRFRIEHDAAGLPFANCSLRGRELLSHSMFNKGTAFDKGERDAFGLRGLLPPTPSTADIQLQRTYANIVRKTDPLEQYIGLAALQDRNETLFYRLLSAHIEEFAPIVYTPTVGRACQAYSHIFRRGRGMWITPEDSGNIAAMFDAIDEDVRLICATDNERILGLGDQGAGGMGIPIGKLVLYTVAAGIHPTEVLPVSLDVGTDNVGLLEDPMYLGWRHARLRGERYDALIEEFVCAVMKRFPDALLQWEDFKKATAFDLLDRYRNRLLSFNDDIQGTAAVALSGVMAATRITKVPLKDHRVVILGAGAAGIGIGRQLRDALKREGVDDASRIALLDSQGLLIEGRDFRDAYKKEFAWPAELARSCGIDPAAGDFESVVKALKPHVLIGASGQPDSFTQPVIEAMAAGCARPVVFPFSNPTSKCEAVPEDLIRWTKGTALVASGSPFDPVVHEGRTHRIGQGNNVYIFPGVGLGALCAKATSVSETMFTVAAETLAANVSDEDLRDGALYPKLTRLRELSAKIAVAVAVEAADEGVAPALDEAEAKRRVEAAMWQPRYVRLEPT